MRSLHSFGPSSTGGPSSANPKTYAFCQSDDPPLGGGGLHGGRGLQGEGGYVGAFTSQQHTAMPQQQIQKAVETKATERRLDKALFRLSIVRAGGEGVR